MRYTRESFSIEAAEEKGRKLPDWCSEVPEIQPGEELYLKAFWILSSCRPTGFSLGLIPWTAIELYTSKLNLDEDIKELTIKVVMALDQFYVKDENERLEKKNKKPTSSIPKKTQKRK